MELLNAMNARRVPVSSGDAEIVAVPEDVPVEGPAPVQPIAPIEADAQVQPTPSLPVHAPVQVQALHPVDSCGGFSTPKKGPTSVSNFVPNLIC
jgi:hypothetical protein